MSLTFIDLFAGIGGFRLALEKAGFRCVFSAENNPHACSVYLENFHENPFCDIKKLDPKIIPDFDLLCAGFPCQSFSIAGKKLGFTDEIRGTLFFDIVRILQEKKPKFFILENVKHLLVHDKGNTLSVILSQLKILGYTVSYQVLNANKFNTPQHRERIILVGSLFGHEFNFDKLPNTTPPPLKDFLLPFNFLPLQAHQYTLIKNPKKQLKSGLIFSGFLNKPLRKKGVRENTEHLSRVHKQPNRIYSSDGSHPTLSSQEKAGRYFILDKNIVRKLSLDECYKMMGFPEHFKKIGSPAKLYERIGNSVCVPMIYSIALRIKDDFCIDLVN